MLAHEIDEREFTQLKTQVATLELEVTSLRQALARIMPSAEKQENAEPKLADVIAVTQEMFGESPTVELCTDPEDAEHPFVVLTVPWRGNPADSMKSRLEWHRRVGELSADHVGTLRLSLMPVQ